MSSKREEFLNRVRSAVAEGNRVGGSPPLPERGSVGFQGAGPDPLTRFRDELEAAGGNFHAVASVEAATTVVRQIVAEKKARRVLVGDGLVGSMDLEQALAGDGVEVIRVATLEAGTERERFFSADVGISGVEHVIAETGTLALVTRPNQPRAVSLLPPTHIAVARREQFLADLFDLFEGRRELPACLTLITGPSKTGDIELKLVTGVHGPGEVHVVVIEEGP